MPLVPALQCPSVSRIRAWTCLLVVISSGDVWAGDCPSKQPTSSWEEDSQSRELDLFERLQGTWHVVSVEVNGKQMPEWVEPSPIRLVGREARWRGLGPGGAGEMSGELQLGAKQFEFKTGGEYWPGLLDRGDYRLDDGTLELSLQTAEKGNQPSVVAVTLKRIQPSTRTLRGHGAPVLHVAFSPNGTTLASVGKDDSIRLWDSGTGRSTAVIRAEKKGSFSAVSFSSDGQLLAAACRNGVVALFSSRTAKRVAKLKGHDSSVRSLAFSPDSKRLASADDNGIVRLWEPSQRRVVSTIKAHQFGVDSIAYSPNGKLIALACGVAPIEIWSTEPLEKRRTIPTLDRQYGTRSIAISHNARWLASSGVDGVRLDEWDSGETIAMIEGHSGGQSSAAFSPDDSLFAAAIYEDIRVFAPESGVEVARLGEHSDWVNTVTFSPDGKLIATGSDDGTIKLWDTGKFHLLSPPAVSVVARTVRRGPIESRRLTFDGHVRDVRTVTFLPDTQILVIGADGQPVPNAPAGGIIKLWSLEHSREISTMPEPGAFQFGSYVGETMDSPSSIAASTDGTHLAVASFQGVRLWNIAGRKPVGVVYGWGQPLPDDRTLADIDSVAISPDGETIAAGGLGFVSLWNPKDRKPVQELSPGGKAAVAFSPDGQWIATAEGGNRLRLWDAKNCREVAVAHAHMGPLYTVAFHPNSRQLVVGGEAGAQLWDVIEANDKTFLWQRVTLPGHLNQVTSATWSPGGRLVATASFDGSVRLWDGFDGRQLVCLDGMLWVWSVTFSPDGKTLAAGGRVMSPRGPHQFPVRRGIVSIWNVPDVLKPKIINEQSRLAIRDFLRASREDDIDTAQEALLLIGPQSLPAAQELEAALKDENASVREASLIALRRMGRARETRLPFLVEALDDESELVCIAAMEALGAIGRRARPVVPELIKKLVRNRESNEAIEAYFAMRSILGESETNRIMSLLKN